ncbi:MAG: transcription antitermination factor NusB [Sphingomonadales bacterium]
MNETGLKSRRAALNILSGVFEKQAFLDDVAGQVFAGSKNLSPGERAFALRLAGTTLRRWGHLQLVIGQLLERPLNRKAAAVHHILGLGLAQILFMETATHAAVSTSVELAAKHRNARTRALKGLVNAVLRRGAREKDDLLETLDDQPLANLPAWLAKRWSGNFGADAAKELARALLERPPLDLTLKAGGDGEKWLTALEGRQIISGSIRSEAKGAISELAGYGDGAWWVQDLAASLPARLLAPVEGLQVADLCAAPGGKTLQLAAMGGCITAVDRSIGRLERLRANIRRSGLSAEVVEADILRWQPAQLFDAVLLDAPCSATGTIRRHPEIPWIREGLDLSGLSDVQDRLLAAAWKLLKPGGKLVYSVCSLEPEECEARIERHLARNADAGRRMIEPSEVGGLTGVISATGDLRTWPTTAAEAGGMDGFFASRLIKKPA